MYFQTCQPPVKSKNFIAVHCAEDESRVVLSADDFHSAPGSFSCESDEDADYHPSSESTMSYGSTCNEDAMSLDEECTSDNLQMNPSSMCISYTYINYHITRNHRNYLAPHRGRARYCNAHVCLFLCLCVCLSVFSQNFKV